MDNTDKSVEHALIAEWQNNPAPHRKDQIFAYFKDLCGAVLKNYYGYDKFEYKQDLEAECYYVITKCLNSFDLNSGYRFSTYVYPAMYRQLQKFVINNSRHFATRRTEARLQKHYWNLVSVLDDEPKHSDIEKLVKETTLSYDDVVSIYQSKKISYENLFRPSGGSYINEAVENPANVDIIEEISYMEKIQYVKDTIEALLPEWERKAMHQRYFGGEKYYSERICNELTYTGRKRLQYFFKKKGLYKTRQDVMELL